MGQFPQDKQLRLPKSLQSSKKKKFLKAAFNLSEVKRLLKSTGCIINPEHGKNEILGG